MCGLAGLIGVGDETYLERMMKALAHRGPDGEGKLWIPELRAGLGHRRLAIIDLSPQASQPMADESQQIWIVYNGEIFNYRELRQELKARGYHFKTESDTEVIINAYKEWGENSLNKLNGMFAFGIIDRRQRRLLAARDRLGVKPFYYWQNGSSLIFASEIKAFKAAKLFPLEPDYEVLRNPSRYQVSPHTGFRQIKKLPAGHYLVFQDGQLSLRKYWDILPREEDLPENEAIEKLDGLLRDAVRSNLISDVPVGLLLSGGLDSSLIGALIAQISPLPINCFTIRFSAKDQKFEAMPDDSRFAREVANKFGFEHREFEISSDVVNLLSRLVWHLDEPLADPAAINLYLMARTAKDNGLSVLLCGMGGDEIFGGYRRQLALWRASLWRFLFPRWLHAPANQMIKALPVASQTRGFRRLRWLKRFFSFAFLDTPEKYLVSDLGMSRESFKRFYGRDIDYESLSLLKLMRNYLQVQGISELTRICLMDTKIFLPDHNLTYSDKASMAAGVELRPPLCDHRLVEFMFSLPPKFRIKGGEQKYLLKKTGRRYLPENLIQRPKAPFGSPLRSWVRGALREMIDDLLSEEALRRRGLLNPKEVRRAIDEDRRGQQDHSLLIWTFLTWEIWFRTFFS